MRIQEETIEKIRTSLDIVDIIGEYVQLKKQGKSYTALCPFHNERTPSFSVSPDKQIFHCFGCGAGGNIFTFVMEIEGFSFPEAVQFLAEKAHIEISEKYTQDKQRNHKGYQEQQTLYQALELLTKFYHYMLCESNYGEKGRDYLKRRGFSQETIEKFQIGFAVDSWEAATNFLQKRGFSLPLLEKAGILSRRHFDDKFFDRFRNRIIFPIWDRRGKAVAFGGRILTNEKPKYINTPESNIFHKGNILYGYHLARSSIKQENQVVLLEGYVDVIKAHQAGITNAVASMGTSLTEEQAGLLTRNAETIIICYDSDQAGIDAAFRAAEMLKDRGRTVKIAKMPENLDPDDYISKLGGERFRNDVIGAGQTLMAFKMDYLRSGRNLYDEGDRMRYIEDVLHEIAGLKKAVERDHYLRQLADEFSISLDALKQQQYQMYRQLKKHGKERITASASKMVKQNKLYPAYHAAERQLIAHMMRSAEITELVKEKIGGSFNIDIHQALAAHLYGFYEDGAPPDISLFIQRLNDPELQNAATDLAMMQINESASDKEIQDYIDQVIKHGKAEAIKVKEEQRRKAEQNQNVELAANLLAEIISMKKEIKGM
ncbi:DNA primase [Scopulibacillus daqui]|uniref:DNA primase n=1 Tax=Scopulibacillus daqui TaxID=1469162 RepID=A0ABS2Q0R9_9BACL|nr:DNA primase [Scopulibacillus daqui]MBM7645788.1 DNA primase [Scopulibacillus daqui]